MFQRCIDMLRFSTLNLELKISISGRLFVHPDRAFEAKGFHRFYNRTQFSGLETHILNSYTNAMVQVMHYSMPVRRLAKSHITVDCLRENCLLCELGFVTRMLEDARGTNCQASNFCKTVGALAHGRFIALQLTVF